ncbi:DUF4382 domain-containing protein [Psychromonas ossibalaenae]|uniref:DUF4382 domain-containing protein n=1 Tax=Psychromonas ossibalaenae TaxID=444922 RepID=UPI00037FDD3A|nr:DUF4382 domain-containing protein [Psychromonas ossibalaenae]
MKYIKTLLAITLSTVLGACGGGGGSDDGVAGSVDSGAGSSTESALFSLGVSDNPADAKIVNIAFKQVVLKSSDGAVSFDVSVGGGSRHVDLLTVQGKEVETLVSAQSVPLGEYQMCIYIENSETANTASSYVKTNDGNDAGLVTNSNGSCGGVGAEELNTGRLFLNKTFTIAAGVNTFVAEFELGKGLQGPHGNKNYWTLKPTSVQLINSSEVGVISGEISAAVIDNCEAEAGGSEFSSAVYLYPASTTLENMGDFRPADTVLPQVAPTASARVNPVKNELDEIIGNKYEFGFVAAGTYSLGYTCTYQYDDPDSEEAVTDGFIMHAAEQDVAVTAEQTTVRDFTAVP